MDTNRLRYFCTIAETGSLTKASQLLNISHSGLSKSIASLEEETKLKLFLPLGRGLEITTEGKWFYQKAQEILRVHDEVMRGLKTEARPLQIGLSEVFAITCAGILAEEFTEPLKILEGEIGEIEGKILSGELDFGIVFSPSPKIELEYLEIGTVKFNSYGREDLVRKLDPKELPYIVPAHDFPFNPLGYKIRDGWPIDIFRNPVYSVSHFAIGMDLVRSGNGVAYMPDFVAAMENKQDRKFKLVSVEEHLKAETKRTVFLVKTKLIEETKSMKRLAKVIRQVCSKK